MDLDCVAQLGYASGNVAFTLFPWFVGGWLLNVYGYGGWYAGTCSRGPMGWRAPSRAYCLGSPCGRANTAALSALNASEWKRKSAAIVNGICQQAAPRR